MNWLDKLIAFAVIVFVVERASRQFTNINRKLDNIMATENEISAAMSLIDSATNKIATNIATIAEVDQKISEEIDAFLAGVKPGTVITDAQVTQLADLASRAKAASEASDAQVEVLKAIASKGATNPVPVPVPDVPTSPV